MRSWVVGVGPENAIVCSADQVWRSREWASEDNKARSYRCVGSVRKHLRVFFLVGADNPRIWEAPE